MVWHFCIFIIIEIVIFIVIIFIISFIIIIIIMVVVVVIIVLDGNIVMNMGWDLSAVLLLQGFRR